MRLALTMILALSATGAWSADLATGRSIYESVCATCHGARGRPDVASPVYMAFDPPPADFTDPLFNSREPAGDWAMVVRHGGHALGLSGQMPAQGKSLTDEEIGAVVAYVKTLADTRDYPPGELNLMLPVRTRKAFPEDEVVWGSRLTRQDGHDAWRNVLEFENRIGRRGQSIVEIVQSDDGATRELAEVELGYKHAVAWSLERQSLWSAAFVLALPLRSDGEEELAPYVAYAKVLARDTTFQGSARAKLPLDALDEGELELAGIVHYVWSAWPRRVFPAMELTATVPFDSDGGDTAQFTALPQLRIGLTRGGHVALNLGLELPLSDQEYDSRVHLTLLWDFADGGFFQSW